MNTGLFTVYEEFYIFRVNIAIVHVLACIYRMSQQILPFEERAATFESHVQTMTGMCKLEQGVRCPLGRELERRCTERKEEVQGT